MRGSALASRTDELHAARTPFVHARVVLAEKPTSAKPGAEALVLPDGTIEGFVGGTCAEATVREQALAVLGTGESRVVRITPTPEDDQPGKVVVHNHCLSGGTLEIFLEPDLPPPLVVVVGSSPIAAALTTLGEAMGWQARTWDGAVPADAAAVVVATHGRDEEEALLAALDAGVGYVGLVASPRRGRQVLASLDVDEAARARVDTPAGLDIGAATPKEVAVSILAGIIDARERSVPSGSTAAHDHAGHAGHAGHDPAGGDEGHEGHGADHGGGEDAAHAGHGAVARSTPGTAIDPVCGMTVAMVDASLHVEHEGEVVWFCGSGCMKAFLADPAAFTG